MTRPMPGPPECTCMSRGNGCSTCLDAIGWDPQEDCPSCPVHVGTSYDEDKRLDVTECDIEYWREVGDLHGARPYTLEVLRAHEKMLVWARFSSHPHALEVTP